MNTSEDHRDYLKELFSKVQRLEDIVLASGKKTDNEFLDNQDFCKLMNISKRTAQQWRDEGQVSFSQIGGKIYYRMSDVQILLDRYYHKAFKK